MLAANPERIQIIQAGQNEPSILSIGSQAVKKNEKTAGKQNLINLGINIVDYPKQLLKIRGLYWQ
jgi:hypothetical protein